MDFRTDSGDHQYVSEAGLGFCMRLGSRKMALGGVGNGLGRRVLGRWMFRRRTLYRRRRKRRSRQPDVFDILPPQHRRRGARLGKGTCGLQRLQRASRSPLEECASLVGAKVFLVVRVHCLHLSDDPLAARGEHIDIEARCALALGGGVELEGGKVLLQVELRKKRRDETHIVIEISQDALRDVQEVKPSIEACGVLGEFVFVEKVAQLADFLTNLIE